MGNGLNPTGESRKEHRTHISELLHPRGEEAGYFY